MQLIFEFVFRMSLAFGGFALTAYFLSIFFERKILKPFIYGLSLLAFALLTAIPHFFYGYYPEFLFTLGIFIYALFFLEGTIRLKLLFFMIEIIGLYFTEVLFAATLALATRNHYEFLFKNHPDYYQLINNILLFVMAFLYFRLSKKGHVPERLEVSEMNSFQYLIAILISTFTLIFAYSIDQSLNDLDQITFSITSTFIFLTIVMTALFIVGGTLLIHKMAQSNSLIRVNRLIENQLSLQLNHYNQLEDQMTNLIKIKHDLRNHLIVIDHLIETKEIEKARLYIEEIDAKFDKADDVLQTGNKIFDAILFEKRFMMKKHDIDFVFDGYLAENCNIHPVDLCTMIANSMDNAIEACLTLDESQKKWIQIHCKIIENHFVYVIRNASPQVVFSKNRMPKTHKSNKAWHGYGLQNISDSVKKYDGDFEIQYSEGEFSLQIFIQLARA